MRCDRCEQPVAATADDPVCITRLGTHHYACMRAAWADRANELSNKREASRARRSAAMKTRWAKEETERSLAHGKR